MRLRHSIALAAAAVVVLGAASARADTGFSVTLDPLQEVPPNPLSYGHGSGTIIVNNAQTQATINIFFADLTTPRNASHIHGPAPVGVNAGVLVALPGPAATFGTLSGVVAVTPTIVGHMLAGNTYVNIHTSTYPGGEIRGQVMLDATPTKTTTWGRIKRLYR